MWYKNRHNLVILYHCLFKSQQSNKALQTVTTHWVFSLLFVQPAVSIEFSHVTRNVKSLPVHASAQANQLEPQHYLNINVQNCSLYTR